MSQIHGRVCVGLIGDIVSDSLESVSSNHGYFIDSCALSLGFIGKYASDSWGTRVSNSDSWIHNFRFMGYLSKIHGR
ncbi:hypothetical protein QJS04_geneDACA018579 [Acorus gramineus]|uniref:Uncharacterized protein n=1 Tax=Acorus gramineus TaxID=55184 RepID=A0AAV9AEZ9_ACOGR|nr:hypothetical protein QJS04_geneDACA018579 [Acorus gramineus]